VVVADFSEKVMDEIFELICRVQQRAILDMAEDETEWEMAVEEEEDFHTFIYTCISNEFFRKLLETAADCFIRYAVNETEDGKNVAMLTIGDPSVYSTYMYIHKRVMQAGFTAVMISGVPSFCAAAARLGISLGEMMDEIHIIPASYDVGDTVGYGGTCVYMKSGKKLAELIELLRTGDAIRKKKMTVYGVTNCGMESERVYRGLDELTEAKGYLTIVIVKYS